MSEWKNKQNKTETKTTQSKNKKYRSERSLQSKSFSISLYFYYFGGSLGSWHPLPLQRHCSLCSHITDPGQELIQLKNIFLFLCSFSSCSLCSLVLPVTESHGMGQSESQGNGRRHLTAVPDLCHRGTKLLTMTSAASALSLLFGAGTNPEQTDSMHLSKAIFEFIETKWSSWTNYAFININILILKLMLLNIYLLNKYYYIY